MNKKGQNAVSKGFFVENYLPFFLSLDLNDKESALQKQAISEEILGMVSPAAEEEVKSIIDEISQLDSQTGIERGTQLLEYIFNNWIAPKAIENKQIMSESNKPKKFNLTVLNNVKTASPHFGDSYFLYGPSEKRICPKLRGKNLGSDVVSEYICRHHCLDGIVIDDNKTVCGEALWRANVMDKYSQEYTDADGNLVGGYIEKRFEINHLVPEENKMNLKPGQTRKQRPPELGSIESRMQAMRQKEADNRNYQPDSNKGDPFVWNADVDQNNVEVGEKEREKRELNTGHQLVEKKSFNLLKTKIAQTNYKSPDIINDDLGPSEDYSLRDDINDQEGNFPADDSVNQDYIEDIIGEATTKDNVFDILSYLNTAKQTNPHLSLNDWDEILTEVNTFLHTNKAESGTIIFDENKRYFIKTSSVSTNEHQNTEYESLKDSELVKMLRQSINNKPVFDKIMREIHKRVINQTWTPKMPSKTASGIDYFSELLEPINQLKNFEIQPEYFNLDIEPLRQIIDLLSNNKTSKQKFNLSNLKLAQAPIPVPDDGKPIEPDSFQAQSLYNDTIMQIDSATSLDELERIRQEIFSSDFTADQVEILKNKIMYKMQSFNNKIAKKKS